MNRHPQHVLRATLVDSPGALTNVVQVFSSLSLEIERLDFQRSHNERQGSAVVIYLRAENRMVDLALRKLGRLVDVIKMHEVVLTAEVDIDEAAASLAVPAFSGKHKQPVIHSA